MEGDLDCWLMILGKVNSGIVVKVETLARGRPASIVGNKEEIFFCWD